MTHVRIRHVAVLLVSAALASVPAAADGTEMLGTPLVALAPGTHVLGAGVGLYSQPGAVQIDVPAGAEVRQVLLYWNGFHGLLPGGADGTAVINDIAVDGTLIGGPYNFFLTTYGSTYRADITGLGLVADGPSANLLTIKGLDFIGTPYSIANGASVVVIVDDGSTLAEIRARDGQDLAYIHFLPPLKSTVPQTLTFAPSTNPRIAQLTVIVSSVQGRVSGSDPIRPNLFKITLNPGAIADDRNNPFSSNVGDEWDHHALSVPIPAGVTSMTLQAVSADPLGSGLNPASMAWIGAFLSVPPALECGLGVVKTCEVRDDPTGNDCIGKVVSLKLQYTAEGCAASNNPQSGKAICTGGADPGDSPVDIRATDTRDQRVYADAMDVLVGEIVEVEAAHAGQSQLPADIRVVIGAGIETNKIHTSCSQPLRVGDSFGSLRVVEMTTTGGGTSGGVPGLPNNECTVPAPPPPPHCEGRVRALSLRYLGGDCTETTNPQDGKAQCMGDASTFEPVRVVGRRSGDVYLDTGEPADVALGDVVHIDAAARDKTELPGDVSVYIYDAFGNQIQQLKIHTSCSQPLDVGDRFGAMQVVGLELKNGNVAKLGATVDYSYEITNGGSIDMVDVSAVDDHLGELPGSPVARIGAGETVILHDSAFVDAHTRNVVVVRGELESGASCPAARASATVRPEEPPTPPQACDSKIEAMLLRYTGPTLVGPATVRIVPDTFRNDPVIYDLPGGLAAGTELVLPAENGFTIDSAVHGATDLGAKTTLYINGVAEVIHTSCSTPFVAGQPAPLDDPKGDPSPNWFVVRFRD